MDRLNPDKDLIYLAATKAYDQFNEVGRREHGVCARATCVCACVLACMCAGVQAQEQFADAGLLRDSCQQQLLWHSCGAASCSIMQRCLGAAAPQP